MTQTDRIRHMEEILNKAESTAKELSDALNSYESLLPAIRELTAYYESPLWRQDFEDDCAGRLPKDLKRGVLSEDAVYTLLSEITALHRRLNMPLPK